MTASRTTDMPVRAFRRFRTHDICRRAFEQVFQVKRAAIGARDAFLRLLRYRGVNVIFFFAFGAAQVVEWHVVAPFSISYNTDWPDKKSA